MVTSKVKVTAFKKLNDDELNIFANTLIANGSDKAFDAYRTTLDQLAADNSDYSTKLQKAKNKGLVEVEARNIAKESLLLSIEEYSHLINALAVRNLGIIGKSGFESRAKVAHRSSPNLELSAPYALNVAFGKTAGEIILTYSLEMPERVVKNGVEWSDDAGTTWHNGTYFSGRKGILKNLPTRKDLLLRVRSLGSYLRESDFSTPISTFLP